MAKRQSQRLLMNLALVVIVLGALAGTAIADFSQYRSFSRENVAAFIDQFGPCAPLAYAGVHIVSSPVPFLAQALSTAGGLLFGPVYGTLYAAPVATVSALIPFTKARQLGREWVESKLEGQRVNQVYELTSGRSGFTFILLLRLVPILPWEIQNYVAGLSKVSVPTMLIATLIGTAPGTFLLALLVSSVAETSLTRFVLALLLLGLTSLGVPAVIILRPNRRRKLNEHDRRSAHAAQSGSRVARLATHPAALQFRMGRVRNWRRVGEAGFSLSTR